MCIRSYVALIVGRVIRGIAAGLITVTVPVFINDVAYEVTKSTEIGFTQLSITFGSILASLMQFAMPRFVRPEDLDDHY